jgi:hypothetical protein
MRKPDLSKLHLGSSPPVPTMIVPPGTQIQVDAQGQVSIRTPGNLVLQNSGAYATLESVSGSIRIEPAVHVEAVTVRCADTCLVQGTLTAWRVMARMLHVDTDAEARVVMQETEKLEVGRNGRVVGNFRSEKELFDLFSRFAGNVRALPSPLIGEEPRSDGADAPVEEVAVEAVVQPVETAANVAGGDPSAEPPARRDVVERSPSSPAARGNGRPDAAAAAVPLGGELDDEGDEEDLTPSAPVAARGTATARTLPPAELPDGLALALLLLEQESAAGVTASSARRSLLELLRLLREGDVETLRHTYKTLFARLAASAGEPVRRARRAVGDFFDAETARRAR